MAKAHTLVDNFNDNTIDVVKWTASGQVREVNGRAEIHPLSGVASSSGKYTSATTYDLTNSEIRVELVRLLRTGRSTLTIAKASGGGIAAIDATRTALHVSMLVGAFASDLALIPYDEAAHRWLRIRENSGTMYFEHSADGIRWGEITRTATPFLVTAVTVEFGAYDTSAAPAPGIAVFDNFNTPTGSLSRRVEERRLSARDVRVQAAEIAAERRHDEHVNNNDEVNHTGVPYVGNYSKSLKHNSVGDPDPLSYGSLLRALESRDPQDFEEIILASSTALKLTNPQAGLAFDLEAPDAQALTMPPAPRFDSDVTAHEMGELYWMAINRDVHFADYGTNADVAAAITSLNGEFPRFGGTLPVTAQNVFRGIYPGEQVGPYVSQFLLKGNNDKRKPIGLGFSAIEGYVSYGARVIDQRLIPAAAGTDYLTTHVDWLDVQNGWDRRGQDNFDTVRRFIRNLRDGATFVHFDQVLDAFYNTAWILMSEPIANQLNSAITGRPQIDLEFPKDQGNPYDPPGTAMDSKTQAGFGTFGPIHVLQVLSEVLGRAIRAVWWQKWGVHRRLRPEEYGGRVDNQLEGRGGDYPVHSDILDSLTTGALEPYFGESGERFPDSFLLPQAYPEGAPTHPAYGAGHATGSGACVTILKAFFDETKAIENPVLANADGLSLVAYTGSDASQMTVGGELNKLAGNVAIFRNAAGVHWRSDYTESLPFGEAIAIGLLQEMSLGFNEDDAFFELTKFDGQKIRIFDGKVVPVVS